MNGMESDANSFIDRLSQSRLLPARQLDSFCLDHPDVRSAKELATRLVRQRSITRWQAEQLLFGRTTFQLGDYVLQRKIGGGATGAVYEAKHFRTGQRRALKVLSPELARDPEYVERFHREVQILKGLDHPAVVRCYTAQRVHDTEFLVMEYVNGPDLGTWLESQRSVPPTLGSKMIEFVAHGLQHIHENGVVHRDIKPSNLILFTDANSRKPNLKIVDFGIARNTLADSSHGNRSQLVLGSVDFMAPEQFEEGSRVDTRADVFALGATLFTMLTGQRLTNSRHLSEKLSERLSHSAPKVRHVMPSCPEALANVVDRCLLSNPKQRFAHPGEVATALRLARKGISSGVTGQSLGGSAQTPQDVVSDPQESVELSGDSASDMDEILPALVTRQPIQASELREDDDVDSSRASARSWMFGQAVLACVLSVGIAFTVAARGRARVALRWDTEAQTAGSALLVDGEPVPLSSDGTTIVEQRPGKMSVRMERVGYEVIDQELDVAWGDEVVFEPEWTQTPLLREKQALQDFGKRWIRLQKDRVDSKPMRALRSDVASVLAKGVDRAHRDLFFACLEAIPSEFEPSLDEELVSRNLGDGWAFGSNRFHHAAAVTDLAFTPDGKVFATAGRDGAVKLYGMPDGEVLDSIEFPVSIESAAFASNATLIVAGVDGLVLSVDVQRNKRQDYVSTKAPPISLSCSPKGRFFAIGSGDNRMRVYRIGESEPIKMIQLSHLVRSVAWSSDESMVAAADARGVTKIWKLSEDKEYSLPASVPAGHLTFNAAPETLTLFGANLRRADWAIKDLEKLESPQLSGTAAVTEVAPEGSWLVELPNPANQTSVRVTGIEYTRRLSAFPTAATYSPALKSVAAGFEDGTVEVYSCVDDEVLLAPLDRAARWTSVAISQDGSKFALGSVDGRVRIFDAFTRQPINVLRAADVPRHTGSIQFLCFCDQDREIVSFDGESLVIAKVNEANSFRSFQTTGPVTCSRESDLCCYKSNDGVVLYEVARNTRTVLPVSKLPTLVAIRSDGSLTAVLDGPKLRVVDRTGKKILEKAIAAEAEFESIRFVSPNRMVVSGQKTFLISIAPFRQTQLESSMGAVLRSTHSATFRAADNGFERVDATGRSTSVTTPGWTRWAVPLDFDVTPNQKRFIWVDGTGRAFITPRQPD
ncbi:MAG: serine/threonine-protein kinase [Planctomycetota bacterium]